MGFSVGADAYDRFVGRYSVPLAVRREHPTFEGWWEPFTLGVGPAGDHVAGLDARGQTELRERCRELLPAAPFVMTAKAWTARGLA